MKLRYEFTNLQAINFNAVKEFGIVVSTNSPQAATKSKLISLRFVE